MLQPRHTADTTLEAGIDEAGRGCLWGPLIAAAVIWPMEAAWTPEIRELATQVRDSKKLTAKRRAAMEGSIKSAAVAWALGRVEPEEIDAIGMTKANRLAFQRALEGLHVKPGRILVDGILGLKAETVAAVAPGAEQIVEPEADNKYVAVAAASVLAKEGHDRIVQEICSGDSTLDSRYGLMSCKGYGTAKHRAGIKEHGMHELHRRLFLRKLLGLEHTVCEREEVQYAFIDEA